MFNFPGLQGPADVRGGGPLCRSSGPFQSKKKRHGKVLAQPLMLRRLARSVQVTASGMKVESSEEPRSDERNRFATRVCLDLLYVLSVLFCHADMMMLHDLSLCASRQTFRARTKTSSDALSFLKNVKVCVYIQKWSAGTRRDPSDSSLPRQTRRQKSIYMSESPSLYLHLTKLKEWASRWDLCSYSIKNFVQHSLQHVQRITP